MCSFSVGETTKLKPIINLLWSHTSFYNQWLQLSEIICLIYVCGHNKNVFFLGKTSV